MDITNFDYELKKMKKRKIKILEELIFELYAFERNKYQLSKLVGISPQAIGPIVDILHNVELIKVSRTEQKRKIPADFYTMDLQSSLSNIELTSSEKEVIIDFLNRFRPVFAEIKDLENELKADEKLELIYEQATPTSAKMFILQILTYLLIMAASVLDLELPEDNSFFNTRFLETQPLISSQLEQYKRYIEEIKPKLSAIPLDFQDHAVYYSKELEVIYAKVWNILQMVVFESVMKKPSIPIAPEPKEDESKKKLKKLVEINLDYSIKKVDDVLNAENKQRNVNMKDLNVTQKKMLDIMGKVQNDKNLLAELDGFYTKINSFSNTIKNLPIGIMGIDNDKEKIGFLNNKIAVEKTISSIVSEVFDMLQKLEKEIQFEGPNANKSKNDIELKMQDIELLIKWAQNPMDILGDTPSKSKIDKKELERKMNKLIDEMIEVSVISEGDLIKEFRENHPNLSVDLKIIKSILNKLVKEKLIPGLEKVKVGKKTEKVYILRETDGDQQEIFELAKNSTSGRVTIPRIIDTLGWKEVKARYILKVLRENGHIEYNKTTSEGETWYIPGILED